MLHLVLLITCTLSALQIKPSIGFLFQNEVGSYAESVKERRFLFDKDPDSHYVNHTVELLIFVDYKLYSRFLNKTSQDTTSSRIQQAKADIKEYVGVMMDSNAAASPWTEQSLLLNDTRYLVNASKALDEFEQYVDTHTLLSKHDHAMLITGYEIERNDDDSVIGVASLGRMCRKKSGSIIQEDNYFRVSFTMAHEMGHSLGSRHDGENNTCSKDDGNTMNPKNHRYTTKAWIFSSCSANYFKDFIDKLNREGRNCLLSKDFTSSVDKKLDKYSHMLYGAIYDVDDQCKLVYGQESYFARSKYNSSFNYETVCINMYCEMQSENDTRTQNRVDAGDGTPCGNQKWCMAGYCVHSTEAPIADAECPFGDTPGMIKYNRTCNELVKMRPQDCHLDYIKYACCHSCKSVPLFNTNITHSDISTPDQQCKILYGNSSRFCRKVDDYTKSYESVCEDLYCFMGNGTCHAIAAADGTPCGSGKWCVGLKCVASPYTNVDCLFGDTPGIIKYNRTCSELVKLRPQDCYIDYVKEACCQSCKAAPPFNTQHRHTDIPTADQQCKALYGNASGFCKNVKEYANSYNAVCKDLFCDLGDICHSVAAADGTPCGPMKWCVGLKCTASPYSKANCLFGDTASDCKSAIPDVRHSYLCYRNAKVCCGTCEKYKNYQDTGNCTYGDKASWCATDIPDSNHSHVCYKNDGNCCETCKKYFDASHKGCEYGDRADNCIRSKCSTYTDDSRTRLCCKTCRGV